MAGNAPGQKRIMKELQELSSSPPSGVTVPEQPDLFRWKIIMEGPSGSPYAGGEFHIDLKLPPTYPFKPPTVQFTTKIYHPNVSNDSPPNDGMMCLGMLKESEWKPSTKIGAVLQFALQLLREPLPDDAVEAKIADQYKNDRSGYEKDARDWTKRYATGQQQQQQQQQQKK